MIVYVVAVWRKMCCLVHFSWGQGLCVTGLNRFVNNVKGDCM